MKEDFLEGMAEILEVDQISSSTILQSVDVDWDSLAIISTIALIDETYGRPITGKQLEECHTVGDILKLVDSE